jgi:hypothetical protein
VPNLTAIGCLTIGAPPGPAGSALDLMEAGRATEEEIVLALMDQRTFRRADFTETHTGEVRARPPLSHELVTTLAPSFATVWDPPPSRWRK